MLPSAWAQLSITLTFEADELDENGFVVDFGDLHFIEDWIDQHLDHATAIWENDPKLNELKALEANGLIKLVLVPSASCEGIAQFLYYTFQPMVEKKTVGRARIRSVHLEEDTKNPPPTSLTKLHEPGTPGLRTLSCLAGRGCSYGKVRFFHPSAWMPCALPMV